MTTDQAPPLAPVWEKLIDRSTLTQLFVELKSHSRILSIRQKGGTQRYAGEEELDLASVYTRLVNGVVHGVQVRYLYDGQEWCDTLLRAHDGWKLLRMKQG
jgi:hypothetical protein